jgi:hypothetical protein
MAVSPGSLAGYELGELVLYAARPLRRIMDVTERPGAGVGEP